MIKNLTTNQILLIAMATILLLLAAFSFYLLQDISAPLPFSPPSPTSTGTPLPPTSSPSPEPSFTGTPTRQTSYTPFAATATASPGTPSPSPMTSATVPTLPSGTTSPAAATSTAIFTPSPTTMAGNTPTQATPSPSPTPTATLISGEFGVEGRVIQNGTPVANVKAEFVDDAAPRQAMTDQGGHYWFITYAPGTDFTLTFAQSDNPQVTPVAEVASLAWIEGTLPAGVNPISLPDLEISLNVGGMIFDLQSPADGSAYSAAIINASNPIQFTWSVYNQGDSYYIELGLSGNDQPIWTSDKTTSTSLMWNGTLSDGNHISQGGYWWRVAATKASNGYTSVVFTQELDITFNP